MRRLARSSCSLAMPLARTQASCPEPHVAKLGTENTMLHTLRRFGMTLAILLGAVAASAGHPRETVRFQYSTSVSSSHVLYLSGDIPELGNNQPLHAIQMTRPTSSDPWEVTVSLPKNLNYNYHYFSRDPSASNFLDLTGNPPVAIGSSVSTSTSSAAVVPPTKTIFLTTDISAPKLWWRQGSGSFSSISMTLYKTGRVRSGPVQEYIWFAWNFGTTAGALGESVEFYFTDGSNANRIPASGNLTSPLDALFVQDANVFDYVPAPTVSVSQFAANSDCVSTCAVCYPSCTTCTYSGPFISSTLLGRDVKYRVYLPRGYSQQTWRRYPVAYMFDGQAVFARYYSCSAISTAGWFADIVSSELANQGAMRECIIVGIFSDPSTRSIDYLPSSYSSSFHADVFADCLIDELKPVIDTQFRTMTTADDTVAMGSSAGGTLAQFLGWYYSGTFGKVGGLSPYLDYSLKSDMKNTSQSPPIRTYLDCGTVGSPESWLLPLVQEVATSLVSTYPARYALEEQVRFVLGEGQSHDELSWHARLPGAFKFLLPPSDVPNELLSDVFSPTYDLNTNGVVNETDISLQNTTGQDLNLDGVIDFLDDYRIVHFVRRTCLPDLNLDGFVDDGDFIAVISAYDIFDCADSSMPFGCPADFNGDLLVDDADFLIYLHYYDEYICP